VENGAAPTKDRVRNRLPHPRAGGALEEKETNKRHPTHRLDAGSLGDLRRGGIVRPQLIKDGKEGNRERQGALRSEGKEGLISAGKYGCGRAVRSMEE